MINHLADDAFSASRAKAGNDNQDSGANVALRAILILRIDAYSFH